MKKILIVDDDAEVRSTLADVIKGAGYVTDEASNGREAVEKCDDEDYNVILLDLMMPEMNGAEALTVIRRLSPRAKIIMVTAFATIESATEAIRKGASDYISKPFKIEEMLGTVSRVLEEARFEEGVNKLFIDSTLTALNNSLRRSVIRMLHESGSMRLMEIARELGIEDHTKVVFHLKFLKEAGLAEQGRNRLYLLTKEGRRMVECLKLLENYLSKDSVRAS